MRGGIGILPTHASVAEALTGVRVTPPPFPLPLQEIHLGWRSGAMTPAVAALRAGIGHAFA